MLFGEIVIVALQSIRANLFRATLTMLGIIIGVGAVITMLAAGAGAQKRIDDQIAALGANILTVNASQFFAGGISRDRQTLVVDDVDALIADSRYLDAVVPEMQDRGQLKLDTLNTNARLIGTTAAYAEVFNYKLSHGRFFTPPRTSYARASSCSAPTFPSGWKRTLRRSSAGRSPSTASRSRSSASSKASAAASAIRAPTSPP